jgi:nucleoid DNA-binding protein
MRKKITPREIAERVAQKHTLSTTVLSKLSNHFWRRLADELEKGNRLDIKGVGRFYMINSKQTPNVNSTRTTISGNGGKNDHYSR